MCTFSAIYPGLFLGSTNPILVYWPAQPFLGYCFHGHWPERHNPFYALLLPSGMTAHRRWLTTETFRLS